MSTGPRQAMTALKQFVTFGLAEEVFAVPVASVQEILELRPIVRMPLAPRFLLGLIDVRSANVPVIDLRTKLGFAAGHDGIDTRIIVLRAKISGREALVGLKTDRVFEVASLDSDDLEAVPDVGVRWDSSSISGVGRRNGRFVTVLDLDCMFKAGDFAGASGKVEGEAAA